MPEKKDNYKPSDSSDTYDIAQNSNFPLGIIRDKAIADFIIENIFHNEEIIYVSDKSVDTEITVINKLNDAKKTKMYYEYMTNGNKLAELGKIEGAITLYEKASQYCPDENRVYFNLGKMYCKLQDWKKAIDAFKVAIDLGNKTALLEYGHALKKEERYEEAYCAMHEFTKAYKAPEAFLEFGDICYELHKYHEAIIYYKFHLLFEPDDEHALNMIILLENKKSENED